MTVTAQDKVDLIRLAALIGRHADALSPFEAELVEACVLRFRDRGDRMTLTINERLVLSDALQAMERASRDAAANDAEAAAGMRGAA